ncbi:hypothetical protein [Portibacter marinus]|uniref:hypothetical protein n=1 Tax=Portibacter marinus TaxID=2898660 RepID=UPI001F28C49C|nr:hypothetical protein [Portibacter marinus]
MNFLKSFHIVWVLLLFNTFIHAQEHRRYLTAVHAGMNTALFADPTYPFTVAADVRYRNTNIYSLTSGITFRYLANNRVGGLLGINEKVISALHLNIGPRLYLTKRSAAHQFYVGANLGAGMIYRKYLDITDGQTGVVPLFIGQANIGFIWFNRIILSTAAEVAWPDGKPGILFLDLKLGYQF